MNWWENIIDIVCRFLRRWLDKSDAAKATAQTVKESVSLNKAAAEAAGGDTTALNVELAEARQKMDMKDPRGKL